MLKEVNRRKWLGIQADRKRAQVVSRIRKAATEDELYAYAIGALGRRMRSVAELKRLLRQRVDVDTAHGASMLERVIRRLKDRGYLNDTQYAAAYTSLRRDHERFGRRRVISELRARGVHAEVIEQAVDAAYDEVDEEQQARAYLRRKRIAKPKIRNSWPGPFASCCAPVSPPR
jgi:regulatory protein